jgi:predicted Rossmann fold flavoprotein
LALEEPVLDLVQESARRLGNPSYEVGNWSLTTPRRVRNAAHVVLTTGGQSYPGSGTTGDGYCFLARLGHTIVPPRPALTPITVTLPWVEELRGITLADVGVRVLENQKCLADRRGSLLFAHFGLSGPVVLDISRVVSGHSQPGELIVELDLLPALKEPALDDFLRKESLALGKKQLAVVLSTLLPRRLCDVLLSLAGMAVDRKAAALSRDDRICLVQGVKHLRLPITGTLGFQKAEVTAGGVSLDEVDSRTMRSKLVPNLWVAGEVLDLDGPIGGYNFQAAWSTGWLAGSTV